MRTKLLTNLMLVVLILAALFIGLLMPLYFFTVSQTLAEDPVIAHMQYPILIPVILMLIALLAAILIAFYLVKRSNRRNIFDRTTVKWLMRMGHCFIVGALLIIIVAIYSYMQLGHEVGLVGTYLFLGILGLLASALAMYFIADLFSKAVSYKEETDLTV